MMKRKLAQHLFPFGGELQVNFAAVFRAALAAHKATCFQTVHQFNGAMVLDLEALGDFGDLGADIRRQPLEREKKLVLTRLKTRLAGCPLAESQEPAYLVPELGQ
ncbi:MAG TPA: hypothetical protein VN682_22100 [Terriglobales bacterium]|nr:hypothetical protein [Terriglobales bacterium]